MIKKLILAWLEKKLFPGIDAKVKELKLPFLPADFDDKVWESMKAEIRKQLGALTSADIVAIDEAAA